MLDVGFVNLVSIISQNPKVTAINSSIEVDLTGQVVSDSIGTRMYSGNVHCMRGTPTRTTKLSLLLPNFPISLPLGGTPFNILWSVTPTWIYDQTKNLIP